MRLKYILVSIEIPASRLIKKIISLSKMLTFVKQVKCEVIVKKLHRMRAMRDMERYFFGLYCIHTSDFVRASAGRKSYTREIY